MLRRLPRYLRHGVGVFAVAALYVVVLALLLFIGRHVNLPNGALANAPISGGLNAALRELLGRGDPTDFLIDFASAHALLHHGNAYGVTEQLLRGVGPTWLVGTANPHPPTALTLAIPFLFLHYSAALCAWMLAMVFALIATMRILGVQWSYSITAGVALSLTFPGAWGITNNVVVIGLGIAIAYRWRDHPLLAGAGVALAAAPKASGLLLAASFLLSGRLRAVLWGGLLYGFLALVPLSFDSHVWAGYLRSGVAAITANAHRPDNASLLSLGRTWGIPDIATLVLIGLVVCAVAVFRRDIYWPVAWAIVATLPIAWMYSALTLLPLFVWATARNARRIGPFGIIAAGLLVASDPGGSWPLFVFPVIALIALVILVAVGRDTDTPAFWLRSKIDLLRPGPPHRSLQSPLPLA